MTLNDLKAAYCARHRMSIDDSAVLHLNGFVQFVESALASLDMAAEEPCSEGGRATTTSIEPAAGGSEGQGADGSNNSAPSEPATNTVPSSDTQVDPQAVAQGDGSSAQESPPVAEPAAKADDQAPG